MRIAIIPARGGSQRIPRKNIKDFAGKPMLAHSIEVAQKSGVFDRIIVSTDDAEIADVARTYGAEVPFQRPVELADAHTGTTEVVRHVIAELQQRGETPTHVCLIYATAPLLLPDDIEQGYQLLAASEAHYVFSAASFGFPIQRAFYKGEQGGVEMFHPEHRSTRSQDLVEAYHDAGQFYWGLADAFMNHEVIFANHSRMYLLPRHRVQDIDTLEDWQRAEYLYELLQLDSKSGIGADAAPARSEKTLS